MVLQVYLKHFLIVDKYLDGIKYREGLNGNGIMGIGLLPL